MTPEQYAANIARALDVQDQSVRLQAAMAAGTIADLPPGAPGTAPQHPTTAEETP